MMKPQTLTGFERYGKTTRHAQFLADMHLIVTWAELAVVIEPFYPKVSEAGGRLPLPFERMLRVYSLQLWFNLSDPAVEEELYDLVAMRSFDGESRRRPTRRRFASFAICLRRTNWGRSC